MTMIMIVYHSMYEVDGLESSVPLALGDMTLAL